MSSVQSPQPEQTSTPSEQPSSSTTPIPYPTTIQLVPPIPSKFGDSTDESEPGLEYLKWLRPEFKTPDDHQQAEYYKICQNNTNSSDLNQGDNQIDENGAIMMKKKYPYAGQGKPLTLAIKDAWATWREMLFKDAQSGIVESQVDLAMAYWRGHTNYQIEQDKDEALYWMNIAATEGRHEVNPKGNCGYEACFVCYAQILYKRMKIWYDDEQRQKGHSVAQVVALHTPHIIFGILQYCDVNTLQNLYQVNNLWHAIISDSRAWAHINMFEAFPIPTIPDQLIPNDSPLFQTTNNNDNNNIENNVQLDSNQQLKETTPKLTEEKVEAENNDVDNNKHNPEWIPTKIPTFNSKPNQTISNTNKSQQTIGFRDSKQDITLFTQLPPLHRNICRVCDEKITPPPQTTTTQLISTTHHNISYIRPIEPYMVEATTVPDPFWKNFACHRECFYKRANGTITPYTLQGFKTAVFQGQLKEIAQQQIEWEKYAFRRLQVPDMQSFLFSTLRPPIKPEQYDEYKSFCVEFAGNNSELIKYADECEVTDMDGIDDGMDDIDCDDDEEDEDSGDEAYGLDGLDHNKEEDEDEDEDDNFAFDIDGFLSGDTFQLLDDNDKRDNKYWQEEVKRHSKLLQLYHERKHLVDWYEKCYSQYETLANVLMAYSSGIMWSEYSNQQFYAKPVVTTFPTLSTNNNCDTTNVLDNNPTTKTDANNSTNENINDIKCTTPIDISAKIFVEYDFMSFPRSFPPQSRKKTNLDTPHQPKQENNTATIKIDVQDLPVIYPGLLPPTSTDTTTPTLPQQLTLEEQQQHLQSLQRAQSPYEIIPDIIEQLTKGAYHQSSFIIDNTPLWLLLTQFIQYRKYAKLFQSFDDLVVEYPTPQQYLFPHGDSRYSNINYSQYLFGQPQQFPPQYLQYDIEQYYKQYNQIKQQANNNDIQLQPPQPFSISLESYINPNKMALPLVYELFQLLLRSTTGYKYLHVRNLILTQLLPRFNLKYNPYTKQIEHFPDGSIIIENECKILYKVKAE